MPPRQRQPNAPISEAMEKLILRALEKDPMDRPQTAEQFRMLALNVTRKVQAEALMAARTRVLTPLPKTDPLQMAPALPPPRRRRRWIVAAVAALLAVALGFVGFQLYDRQAVSESSPVVNEGSSTISMRDPAKAKKLVAQASEASGRQDTGGALSLLHEALLLDPDNAEAHYRMASLLLLENRTERAREEYEAAKRLDPTRFTKQVDQILRSL
jgi:tetratricopeptide (TPR) repeat protein